MENTIFIDVNEKKTEFIPLDNGLVFTKRKDVYFKKTKIIETFANNWFIGFVQSDFPQLSLRSQNKIVSLVEPSGVLIPPMKIIEWHIEPGKFSWSGYFSKSPLPFPLLENPCLFSWGGQLPRSYTEMLVLLKNIQIKMPLIESRDNSWLSEKVKSLIDAQFTTEIKIDEIANNLKVHRSFLTRSFKKSYGLSPVAYRHHLRVFEGLKLLNQEQTEITAAAYSSGFSSLNRFEHHFKTLIGVPPNKYHFVKVKS